jgi:phage host-nuclease inhibitor protein Gam
MQADNFEETLKLQEEFRARLLESTEALRAERAPSREMAIKDREALMVRTRRRLENAVKDRDAIVRHWDERIARLEAEVEALTTDVKQLASSAAEEKESGKAPPRRARKKPKP